MKTILAVCSFVFLFGCVHIEAVTDEEFHAVLTRLTALEEMSNTRISSLEKDIVSYEKRVADLEAYKHLSDSRNAILKRKNEFFNSRILALEMKLSGKKMEWHKKGKTLSENIIELSGKNMAHPDIVLQSFEKKALLPVDMSGQDDRKVASADRTAQSAAGHPLKNNRFVAEGIVAFSAMKIAAQSHLGVNQNIIFEQVLTNEGGGYHPNHGVFIAPQSGVYVMSSSVLTTSNGLFRAAITHNGNIVARIYGHGDSGLYDQGSQMAVIKLNAGDEVAVQNTEDPDNTIFGTMFSSFSGYLLWQP